MEVFDLSIDNFRKEMQKLVNEYTPKELLQELRKCGYKGNLPKQENRKEKV